MANVTSKTGRKPHAKKAAAQHGAGLQTAFQQVRELIVHGKLSPGMWIVEADLAQRLGMSRTPVREAFIKLAQETLLDIVPQKGTYISLIDPDQVEESKFLRETVEKEVIKLACRSFSKEDLLKLKSNLSMQELCVQEKNYLRLFAYDEVMHGIIFAACRKSRIWSMIQQMNTHYNRVRMMNLALGYDWERIIEQHKLIIDSIERQDPLSGERAIDIHLNKLVFDLKYLQQEFSHYFKPLKQPSVSLRSSAE